MEGRRAEIFISAGHGGLENGMHDTGAVVSSKTEAAEMIRIRDLLVPELRSRGWSVLAVPDDLSAEQTRAWINQRCQIEDIALAIHTGNATNADVRGAIAYYITNNEARRSHAELMVLALLRRVPQLPSRGVKPDRMIEKELQDFCRQVNCPALVMEVGCLPDPQDFAILRNQRREIALGIADGLASWNDALNETSAPLEPPAIDIKVNGRRFEAKGILINDNAYVPIHLLETLGIDLANVASIPQATYQNTVFLQAIDLQTAQLSVGWDVSGKIPLVTFDGSFGQVTTNRQKQRSQCFTEPAINLDLMLIPGGTFTMGSPEDELGRYDDEGPQHEVAISTFLMGRYPITQEQYERLMETNPATEYDLERFVAPDKPVVGVSWEDAVAFCDRLSKLTNHTYRLPTEAEWEYACRAGTDTPFHFGATITTELANYCGEDDESDPENYPGNYGNGPKGIYRQATTPVNHFHPLANAFGLCDMHGNVWEWCLDHWHSDYEGALNDGSAWLTENADAARVRRGGSWGSNPRNCRSAVRYDNNPGNRYDAIGFRVVCEARGL